MGVNFESIEELRRKKALLKNDINDLEDLLTFKNTKESLSAFSHGFTDQYLKEVEDEDGHERLKLNTNTISRKVGENIKDVLMNKNAVLGFAGTPDGGSLIDSVIKMGTAALVANFAQKNIKSGTWKQKIIGVAIVYLAPYALRFIREKLEDYQKNKSVSSLEKII